MVYDPHGKIGAFVSILSAVQDPLCGIPHGAADDGLMVVGLEILIFLSVVFLLLMVFIIWRIGFSCQYIPAVFLISEHRDNSAG